MAMDVIPIQASSVSSERVFSSGKQTITPRRSRISPRLMEILQILKFSIRKGRRLSFTEGMSWSDELKEFELAARTVPPSDPEAYVGNGTGNPRVPELLPVPLPLGPVPATRRVYPSNFQPK